jgi:hypothetical protein
MSTQTTAVTTPAYTAESSKEALLARIAQLERKAEFAGEDIKLGEKGNVIVYGFGRYPVALYASQWAVMFAKIERIKAFIEANKSRLSVKAEAK